ncbi:unnamed protein product [Rotaria sordida]|uniref:Uncharacterized protein n=1 Tax=Rotaria sordida TaxID=392033 RepID=A0A818VH44_9BILA|nr:unnamed protein product [Rotaria sordida]CAF0986030.1 unnamed protein product [Rotaria sordida]CAF3706309.1 unnamed protein product [Rotaria sordida]CAF3764952.1 unnamed protein product [Rotaria sordida]
MLIEVSNKILFITGVLLLVGIIYTNASRHTQDKTEKLIQSICEKLYDDDLYSEENQQWSIFCEKWIKSMNHQQHNDIENENVIDESLMKENYLPRKFSFRSGFRSGGSSSRISSRISRSSSSGSSNIRTSGSRISSIATRFRNTRTGATVSRPTGWLWSRTRHVFLPVSQHYYYRSHSSNNRYTTPPTGNVTYYYYCTSNTSSSMEIQCSSINDDDGQCCEDETISQVFCCGGKIDDYLIEDFNQATKTIARIFYTLTAITLFIHIFMRRFY